MTDHGYDVDRFGNPVAQGFVRVRLALEDRLERKEASAVAREWEASRFTATEALDFVVAGVLRPVGVENAEAQ